MPCRYHRIMNFDAIDWGDFPTSLLAGVTFLTLVSAGMILWMDRKRDQKREEVERRTQASLVSAWTEAISDTPHDPRLSNYFINALVLNGSDQPIYEIEVAWCQGNEIIRIDALDLIPPKVKHPLRLTTAEFCKVLGQEENASTLTNDNACKVVESLRIEITFTDTRSQRWIRGRDGLLMDIKSTKK